MAPADLYSYIHSHTLTHAELWRTNIPDTAWAVFTHTRLLHRHSTRDWDILKWISVWVGRAPDNCIMFRDEEETWQGAMLKRRRPFLFLFLPSWSFKAAGIFSLFTAVEVHSCCDTIHIGTDCQPSPRAISVYECLHVSLCQCWCLDDGEEPVRFGAEAKWFIDVETGYQFSFNFMDQFYGYPTFFHTILSGTRST